MQSLLGYLSTAPDEDITMLMSAVMCADLKAVREIMAERADVNQTTSSGDNALTRAAALHEPAMMKIFGNKACTVLQELLQHGANPHNTPRLGSPDGFLLSVLYWTQLHRFFLTYCTKECDTTKFPLVGNRAIGLLQPKEIRKLVKSQKINISTTDNFGECTLSYLLMTARKNNCLENTRLLLELGCTVRNHERIVQALMRTGTGQHNNACFPSLGPYADNDWIFPSNRYWKYKQLLSLLGAGGMDPNSIDKVEALITHGYDPEGDQLATREIIAGKRRYIDPCEYDMASIKESPPSLMRFCRATVRKHLMKVNHGSNLLATIPDLPLPRTIQNYLLYKSTWYHIIVKQFK